MTKGRGGWVSYVPKDNGYVIDGEEVGFHSAEIGALRRAVKIGGLSIYVEFGQTLGEAIDGTPTDQRMPGEEPLPLGDPPEEPIMSPVSKARAARVPRDSHQA